MNKPILYSFRRCPYAIRARMALYYSGVMCELREVVLKSKPVEMLAVSPKGTVPVLLISDDQSEFELIEESIDVIQWALDQNDPDHWLQQSCQDALIAQCDDEFKHWLDRYKYADRYPDFSMSHYFDKACSFLQSLEHNLYENNDCEGSVRYFLNSNKMSVLDIAIFPFVRQFAFVDKKKFDALDLPKLQIWLECLLTSQVFLSVMQKYPMWVNGETQIVLFGKQN